MDAYEKGMQNIQPHGPSAHAEVIKFAAEFSAIDEVSQEN